MPEEPHRPEKARPIPATSWSPSATGALKRSASRQSAERDFDRIKACRLVKNRVGELFAGVITGVSKYGFYVTLKEIPVEGMVPLRALTDDYYLVKEDDYTVIGRRHGRRFRIGDAIRVKLSAVDADRMFIDFEVMP